MLKIKGDGYTYGGTAYDIDTELTLCFDADTKTVVANTNCAAYEDELSAKDYFETADMPAAFDDFPNPSDL